MDYAFSRSASNYAFPASQNRWRGSVWLETALLPYACALNRLAGPGMPG
jgi:hypothetical protein